MRSPSARVHLLSICSILAFLTFIPSTLYCQEVNDVVIEKLIKRSDFPKEFLFGASTSAIQIEGSIKGIGRGPSVWDEFAHKYPEKIENGSTVDVAIDSYTRFIDDIKLLKKTGLKGYRFSFSWTRIVPTGSVKDGINQPGIDHYNRLVDELLANGLTPLVTLFHFDSPQDLQAKNGGFLNRSIVKDFEEYAEICFRVFGDRVKHWITINEPLVIAQYGYELGVAAPGRCTPPTCEAGNSSTEPYIVSHHLLLAHAAAATLYKKKFQAKQRGEIGISHVGEYYEPYSSSVEDRKAANRAMEFYLGWYMEPLVTGSYPLSMRNLVKDRLPKFTEQEKQMVKGSFDFIGINYYTSRYAKAFPRVLYETSPQSFTNDSMVTVETENASGNLIGPLADGIIYVYPKGLRKLMEYMKKNYQSPKIYITENGVSEPRNDSRPLSDALNDQFRVTYVREHLYQLHKAIKTGVNVAGYFYWSLFDSFEFGNGYKSRFGLHFIDYHNNLTRIPKQSLQWFHKFLNDHKFHNRMHHSRQGGSRNFLNGRPYIIHKNKWGLIVYNYIVKKVREF